MNSSDVNSIINNLCDKLGTTASKLVPEMAGYQKKEFRGYQSPSEEGEKPNE